MDKFVIQGGTPLVGEIATSGAKNSALPALADTRFQIRRMTRNDVPLGKGQCDIRLQVDNEVEVAVRRDVVNIRTISGRDARDDGSECNAPLPDRDVPGFNYQVMDSRNEIRLLAEPSPRNDFTAIVRIRDSASGEHHSPRREKQFRPGPDRCVELRHRQESRGRDFDELRRERGLPCQSGRPRRRQGLERCVREGAQEAHHVARLLRRSGF